MVMLSQVAKTRPLEPKGEIPLRGVKAVERQAETGFSIVMQTGDWEAEREPFRLRADATGSAGLAEATRVRVQLIGHARNSM